METLEKASIDDSEFYPLLYQCLPALRVVGLVDAILEILGICSITYRKLRDSKAFSEIPAYHIYMSIKRKENTFGDLCQVFILYGTFGMDKIYMAERELFVKTGKGVDFALLGSNCFRTVFGDFSPVHIHSAYGDYSIWEKVYVDPKTKDNYNVTANGAIFVGKDPLYSVKFAKEGDEETWIWPWHTADSDEDSFEQRLIDIEERLTRLEKLLK